MKKIFLGTFLTVLIFSGFWFFLPKMGLTDTVSVTASVSTSVTCSASTTTTAFGTLTVSSVYTATPSTTLNLSCNYGAGCTLNGNDAGGGGNPGLWNASATDIIQSANATLTNGVEGYGIQAATTSNGSGATLSINYDYLKTGNNVGGLTLATKPIATSSAPVSGREIVVDYKAAISGLTSAGSYTDTVTYGCVGN